MANEAGIADDERMKKVREARINSLDILRAKERITVYYTDFRTI